MFDFLFEIHFEVHTSKGTLWLALLPRRRRAWIHPNRLPFPHAYYFRAFRSEQKYEDPTDLGTFISSTIGIPGNEARDIAQVALIRVQALRRLPWWKRLSGSALELHRWRST
jgi:hypothetical protein